MAVQERQDRVASSIGFAARWAGDPDILPIGTEGRVIARQSGGNSFITTQGKKRYYISSWAILRMMDRPNTETPGEDVFLLMNEIHAQEFPKEQQCLDVVCGHWHIAFNRYTPRMVFDVLIHAHCWAVFYGACPWMILRPAPFESEYPDEETRQSPSGIMELRFALAQHLGYTFTQYLP